MSKSLKDDLRNFSSAHKTIDQLRKANRTLQSQLDKSVVSKQELVQAVREAASAAFAGLEIPPVQPPKLVRTRGQEEVAICVMSDWQLGKRTPTYTSEICAERVANYVEKVAKLTTIQRADHPVKKCHVYLLGDMLEGELIFGGQAHRIDASLYRQVAVYGPRILATALRQLLQTFETVRVICVIGNHGAIGGKARKEMHPESNADLMLYTITKDLLAAEKRLEWDIPFVEGERSWYAVDQIYDKKFFLFHGDQMRGGGFGGLPYYGFGRAVNNWAAGVIPEGFNYAICGHWHQAASIPINDRILWVNGSTESSNEWLREELKAQCPPSQWLLFAAPKGVSSEYRVWL